MKRTVFLYIGAAAMAVLGSTALMGCGGPDNSADVEALKNPAPTNNPDVPKPSEGDMKMTDDPKSMKGKGPGAGGNL